MNLVAALAAYCFYDNKLEALQGYTNYRSRQAEEESAVCTVQCA